MCPSSSCWYKCVPTQDQKIKFWTVFANQHPDKPIQIPSCNPYLWICYSEHTILYFFKRTTSEIATNILKKPNPKLVLRLLKDTHFLSTKSLKTKIITRYSNINIRIYLNSYHNANVRTLKKTQLQSQVPPTASAQLIMKVMKINPWFLSGAVP